VIVFNILNKSICPRHVMVRPLMPSPTKMKKHGGTIWHLYLILKTKWMCPWFAQNDEVILTHNTISVYVTPSVYNFTFACWVLKFKFLILIKFVYGYKAKLIMMMFKTFHHHWSKWFSCPIHLQPFMLYTKVPTHFPTFFEEPKVRMEYFQCVTIELCIAHT
jgi:hypothetical protein